ncbi:hypothetical protein J6590_074255 [Homalodisca vitripennis]|nr:hypothetical protein J6590_074255 [Homalodisca vitripennis]
MAVLRLMTRSRAAGHCSSAHPVVDYMSHCTAQRVYGTKTSVNWSTRVSDSIEITFSAASAVCDSGASGIDAADTAEGIVDETLGKGRAVDAGVVASSDTKDVPSRGITARDALFLVVSALGVPTGVECTEEELMQEPSL